jgi:hypothetical protein
MDAGAAGDPAHAGLLRIRPALPAKYAASTRVVSAIAADQTRTPIFHKP